MQTDRYSNFKDKTISDILQYKSRLPDFSKLLISVHEHDSLGHAMKTLRDENIQGVPVYKNMSHGREYIGIIGIDHILAWTLFKNVFQTMMEEGDSEEAIFNRVVEETSALFHTPIGELLDTHTKARWCFHSSDSIQDLLCALTTGDLHRVLVINDDDTLQDAVCDREQILCTKCCAVVVTRADVIRFIWDEYQSKKDAEFCEQLDRVMEQSAIHFAFSHRKAIGLEPIIVTMPLSATALHTFRTLYSKNVSAIAIVDQDRRLVANVSSSDVRGLTPESLEDLLKPVFEYLETSPRYGKLQADQIRYVETDATVHQVFRMVVVID
jgi:CBS domain-containing protein